MTNSFGEAAGQWASLASRLLGWRPAEFWHATPTELATALHDPAVPDVGTPPSQEQIAQMMERDNNG